MEGRDSAHKMGGQALSKAERGTSSFFVFVFVFFQDFGILKHDGMPQWLKKLVYILNGYFNKLVL